MPLESKMYFVWVGDQFLKIDEAGIRVTVIVSATFVSAIG